MLLCWTSCGDVYRPLAEPIIGPGPDPQKSGSIYALYRNPVTDNSGTEIGQNPGMLSKINISGDTDMANMVVGKGPVAATYLGGVTFGLLFVANTDGTVTYQSSSNFQLPTTLNLFSDPSVPGFALPSPSWITSNQSTRIYLVNKTGPAPLPSGCASGSGTLSILSSQSLVATVCAGMNPIFAVQISGGGKVYVLNTGAGSTPGTVNVLDPTLQMFTTTIPVGINPVWAAFNADSSRLYVVNQGDNTVSIINTQTDTPVANSPVAVGAAPNFAIFEKNRNRLYVTNGGGGSLSVLDLSHGDPAAALAQIPTSTVAGTATVPTWAAPLPDGTRVYVANSGTADVAVIDATTLSLVTGNAGYCTKPDQSNHVSCPSYDTIPLRWDFSGWSTTAAPTPVLAAQNPVPSDILQNAPLRIESELSSTKIYVTTPYNVPQSAGGTIQPGLTVIRTLDNSISSYIPGPQRDVNCQPNPATGVTCAGQIPVMILAQPHS